MADRKIQTFKPGRFLDVKMVRSDFFPSRSERWIVDKAKSGAFGDCVKDGGGWLIPEAGILEYLERNRVITSADFSQSVGVLNLQQYQSA